MPGERMMVRVPKRPEEVDQAWLQAMLDQGGHDSVVTRVRPVTMVRGAGTKLCVDVDYADNVGALPTRLWIKAGWEEHSDIMALGGVYVREARFYNDFATDAGVRAPCCYGASWQADGDAAVILEDLYERGADLWDCRVPRSVADVRAMLDTLARLHARWWEDPSLLTMFDVPMRSEGPMAIWPRMNGAARLNDVLSGPRGEGLPAHVRDGDRIEKAFWRMVNGLETAAGGCLLHGDPHPGNAFTDKDGGAGLFDWQTASRGPWAFDVAYMIVTALSVEDRRAQERELLDYYLDRLAQLGVRDRPSVAQAWDEYRRHIAYAMLVWPSNHISHQSEENIRAMTWRLCMAADDFDYFALWGV